MQNSILNDDKFAEMDAVYSAYRLDDDKFAEMDAVYSGEQTAEKPVEKTDTDGSFDYGIDNMQKMFGKGVESFAGASEELVGVGGDVKQWGVDYAKQQDTDIAEGGYKPDYEGDFSQQEGFGKKLGWALEKTVENAPMGGAALAGGAAAAITSAFSMPVALVIGGITQLGSTFLNAGDALNEMEEKGVDPNYVVSSGVGILAGILDRIGAGGVFKKTDLAEISVEKAVDVLLKKGKVSAGKELAKIYGKEISKRTGGELLTEEAQEALIVGGAASQGADYSKEELIDRAINTAIVTTGLTAPMSAGSAGIHTNNVRKTYDLVSPSSESDTILNTPDPIDEVNQGNDDILNGGGVDNLGNFKPEGNDLLGTINDNKDILTGRQGSRGYFPPNNPNDRVINNTLSDEQLVDASRPESMTAPLINKKKTDLASRREKPYQTGRQGVRANFPNINENDKIIKGAISDEELIDADRPTNITESLINKKEPVASERRLRPPLEGRQGVKAKPLTQAELNQQTINKTEAITTASGKPFKNEKAANRLITRNKKLSHETHEAVSQDNGYVVKPKQVNNELETKAQTEEKAPRETKSKPLGNKETGSAGNNKSKGLKSTVYKPDGGAVDTDFEIIEASNLIDSSNASYAKDLQPRNRDRKASEIQVNRIANNLNPELLGDSRDAGSGAPIIGSDNMVESGNGRTMALKKAYQQGGTQTYQQYLKDNASKFGVSVDGFKEPVLVRRRQTELDRVQFAKEANHNTSLNMSPVEQAKGDSTSILSDDLISKFSPDSSGNINAASNQSFIQDFIKKLPESEVAEYTTKDGKVNKRLIDRVKNAVFHRAYGNDKLIEMVAEDTGNESARVVNSLIKAAPRFTKLNDTKEISDGAELFVSLKSQGKTVANELSQVDLFGDANNETLVWAGFFEKNIKSGKRIDIGLNAVADILEDAKSLESMNDMFGKEKPTNQEVYDYAKQTIEKAYNENEQNNQGSLFGSDSTSSNREVGAEKEVSQKPNFSRKAELPSLNKNNKLKRIVIKKEVVNTPQGEVELTHTATSVYNDIKDRLSLVSKLTECLS